uniref:RNase H type-1 domain-containing protein n=1 Tax=Cannabis sativa TaxID=3483 RepID=A0A803R019_CANSA
MLVTIDVSDPLEAETWALLYAAQLCRLHGWISLTLASYFQQLVHGILAHKALDWRSATVFEALNELMVGLINFIVVWFSQLSVFNIIGS